jgi:hypothetical protein
MPYADHFHGPHTNHCVRNLLVPSGSSGTTSVVLSLLLGATSGGLDDARRYAWLSG